MIFNNIHLVQQSYPLHLPQNYLIHSTLPIFILSTQPYSILTVDMFGSYLTTKNPRARRIPPTLGISFFQAFFGIYFCTFDINTTVSTWLVRMELMSLELSVLGNISTAFFALSVGGNITITSA